MSVHDRPVRPISPLVAPHGVSFRAAVFVWMRIAALSFGGPAGQIAVMHRILVEEKRWISENRFLYALNYCMLLPGPEATQLATYIGWLLHRTLGGVVAGVLFVLPGFVAILALSVIYVSFQGIHAVDALFFGLKPAVMAIVVEAVVRIGKRALKNRTMVVIAGAAFTALCFFNAPFPAIIVGAGIVGYVGGVLRPDLFKVIKPHSENLRADGPTALADDPQEHTRPTLARAMRVSAVCLTLWWAPVLALVLLLGTDHTLTREAFFFSKAAVVTFGGAYSVLAYIAQQAVEIYGWLRPGEMLDGLGMAETTPGPLIQVVQFVAFLGAYRQPGALSPMAAAFSGALITTWVTYVPCFYWIFLGAPYIERLRHATNFHAALSAITAAVVGVILNLAVWFSLHTLFGTVTEWRGLGLRVWAPDWHTVNGVSCVLAVLAFVSLFYFKWGMLRTLAGSVALGAACYFFLLNG